MLEYKTFDQFNKSWTNTPLEQLTAEVATVGLETNHNCDSFHYIVGKNGLIDPNTGQLIAKSIEDKTSVGKKEKIVCEDLFSCAKKHKIGCLAVWVSPPVSGLYPGTKIMIHERVEWRGYQATLNRAILADIDAQKAVDIANIFSSHSKNSGEEYIDPEKVRSQLFVMKEGMSVIGLLNLFVDDPELIKQIKSGQDLAMREEVLQKASEYSSKIRAGISSSEVYNAMVSDGFIGSYNISCPSVGATFSGYMMGHALVFGEYKHIKNCGKCGVVIEKLMKKGDHCHCCKGEYQGC